MLETAIIHALIRILENQITIKERLGIIRNRDRYIDNEFYLDDSTITDLEKCLHTSRG